MDCKVSLKNRSFSRAMMKKLALCAAAFLLMTAAANAEPGPLGDGDFVLCIGGIGYSLGAEADELLAQMEVYTGGTAAVTEQTASAQDGVQLVCVWDDAVVTVAPDDTVRAVRVYSPAIATVRGVHIGASAEEVRAAYGDDCIIDYDKMIYQEDFFGPTLTFRVDPAGGCVLSWTIEDDTGY